MKGIVVTKENMDEICGKLNKFFNTGKNVQFTYRDAFNCGKKKKVPKCNYGFCGMRFVNRPHAICLHHRVYGSWICVCIPGMESIDIVADTDEKIKFCGGNKITIKQLFDVEFNGEKKFIYRIFER